MLLPLCRLQTCSLQSEVSIIILKWDSYCRLANKKVKNGIGRTKKDNTIVSQSKSTR
jgi:hypothetical protein